MTEIYYDRRCAEDCCPLCTGDQCCVGAKRGGFAALTQARDCVKQDFLI